MRGCIWPTGSSGFESPPSSSAGTSSSVGIAADFPTELAARAWRVVADDSARTRLERWLEDANAPQAYRSADGAIVMADRVWGGNVECEPAVSVC